ncbi:MAG: PAS domain S-box protein [Magnetococcales bacterium]|nr:PAS domain S-box protein [Magnetococcales bacterium]
MKKKPHILLVDDDPDILILLKKKLSGEGYVVSEAENGVTALNMFRLNRPDLVLLDADLPGLDGFSTCEGLKNLAEPEGIPVIMVTALDDEDSVDRAFASGAEEYVAKPINWAVLRQRLRLILERHDTLISLKKSEEQLRSVTDSTADAMISVDSSGSINFWNNGAERVFGYTADEVINEPVTLLIPKELQRDHKNAFQQAIETGELRFPQQSIESIGRRKDGETFPIEISLAIWQVSGAVFISAVIRDITERKRVMEGTALFDAHIIEQIMSIWSRVSGSSLSRISFMHVRSLMETVFLAGLYREEDRPVLPRVSLVDQDEIANHPEVGLSLSFRRRHPFTVDTLVKLSGGFDPESSAIAVSTKLNDPRILQIWGVVLKRQELSEESSPHGRRSQGSGVLTVKSDRAGSLAVSWGDKVLARFHGGHFSEPEPGSFTSCLVGRTLFEAVQSHMEYQQFGAAYWNWYRVLIEQLLMTAGRGGHGGIVLWIPDENDLDVRNSMVAKYMFTDGPSASELIEELCLQEDRFEESPKKKKKIKESDEWEGRTEDEEQDAPDNSGRGLSDHVNLLSHLTRVDGALVVSHRIRPLSFGAVLSAPQWWGNTVYCLDDTATATSPVDLSKYGTRHASAVNFVGHHPGVVAFVISQDGPIAALVNMDKDTVGWFPDFRNRI